MPLSDRRLRAQGREAARLTRDQAPGGRGVQETVPASHRTIVFSAQLNRLGT